MEVPTDKAFSEDQARFYFQDLLKGIGYRELDFSHMGSCWFGWVFSLNK